MLRIGELSAITKVSIKTIRYYEEEGLIQPIEVDKWTNYRYYDESSVKRLSQIIYLKDLGFQLKEIKNLTKVVLDKKIKELKEMVKKSNQSIHQLSLIKDEGELMMKNFVNDEKALGKWKRVAVAKTKEDYYAGKYAKIDGFDVENLYFLPKGEGYWIFWSWTKGELDSKGIKFPYTIENDKLILGIPDFKTGVVQYYLIFKQVENKLLTKEEIEIKDNVDIDFIRDEKAIGTWKSCAYVSDIDKFSTKEIVDDLFLESMTLAADGKAFLISVNNIYGYGSWSKGAVANKNNFTLSKYIVKEIDKEDYLFMEWKSGDYIYNGKIHGYYVFKKVK